MAEDDRATAPEGTETGWPVDLRGVTESVVTTLGPNGRWNVAALGLHAPASADGAVTARTWGRTRTWRNFRERGEGYVQFTHDPVDFVEAALTVREEADPILDSADAWVRVGVDRIDEGTDGETQWVEWALEPVEAAVERETVPATNRGYNAVIEATVAASRLDVQGYDREALLDRIDFLASVVETAGSDRDRDAFARLRDAIDR
jgi:hypothetical protein